MAPTQSETLELAETPLSFLHEDIILDNILVRLPVKSVGRFRCVSKSWNSFLSNPKFARANLSSQPEGSFLLRYRHFRTVNLISKRIIVSTELGTPLSCNSRRISLLGSCHGLVLVALQFHAKACREWNFCLFNPITLETQYIPISDSTYYRRHGLGYDSLHDDYKIISISYRWPGLKNMHMHIYSVKMGTWRTRMDIPYEHVLDNGKLFLNGCLHWFAFKLSGGSAVIAAFSVSGEKFEDLPLPQGIDHEKTLRSHNLTVLGGCLAMKSWDDEFFSIWVMKEYGVQHSWTKFIVPTKNRSLSLSHVSILGEDEFVFTDKKNRMVAYNRKSGGWENIGHVKFHGVTNFRESLISPNYR